MVIAWVCAPPSDHDVNADEPWFGAVAWSSTMVSPWVTVWLSLTSTCAASADTRAWISCFSVAGRMIPGLRTVTLTLTTGKAVAAAITNVSVAKYTPRPARAYRARCVSSESSSASAG